MYNVGLRSPHAQIVIVVSADWILMWQVRELKVPANTGEQKKGKPASQPSLPANQPTFPRTKEVGGVEWLSPTHNRSSGPPFSHTFICYWQLERRGRV